MSLTEKHLSELLMLHVYSTAKQWNKHTVDSLTTAATEYGHKSH